METSMEYYIMGFNIFLAFMAISIYIAIKKGDKDDLSTINSFIYTLKNNPLMGSLVVFGLLIIYPITVPTVFLMSCDEKIVDYIKNRRK